MGFGSRCCTMTKGHPAWLLGEARRYGWWYYFPVGLAVKTPLALLALLGVGIAVCWRIGATWLT